MPFALGTFMWDYDNFDYIRDAVDVGKFFNVLDDRHSKAERLYDGPDGYTFYKYLDVRDEEGYETGDKFEYRVNSDSFRDSHFDKLKDTDYNILAIGCSYTFGHGLPEEASWPRLFEYKMKSLHKNTKVFNLGQPGLGIDVIINNTISFISKYGAPDAIVALFPDMNRNLVYAPEFEKYKLHTPRIFDLKHKKVERTLFFKTKNYCFEDRVYHSINQIKMLETLCSLAGIKLFWNSWSTNVDKLYESISFSNYLSWPLGLDAHYDNSDRVSDTVDLSEEKYGQYRKLARDYTHPGIEYHSSVANFFYNGFKENIENT